MRRAKGPDVVVGLDVGTTKICAVVAARGYSSRSITSGSPFFCGTLTGMISSLNLPA